MHKLEVDLGEALRWMRSERDIRILLCEGGPTINDQLIRAGLADELFLTLAPKLKGGSGIATIMTGEGFPVDVSCPLSLISVYRDDDELYLRYRIGREEGTGNRGAASAPQPPILGEK
jgi:riboflavin biosynthesis pyrimidine reductase